MQIVSQHFARKIIENRKPLGTFITKENGKYIGISNYDGNAWTEEFDSLDECLNWINGKEDE